jgi:predicted ATPase
MSVRSIQFLTRLSACVTEAQAALAASDALIDDELPVRDVADALIAWDELRNAEVQVLER